MSMNNFKEFFAKLATSEPIDLFTTRKVIKLRKKLEDKIKTKNGELIKILNELYEKAGNREYELK